MKKIFTFAAAVLASVAMMAQEFTFTGSSLPEGWVGTSLGSTNFAGESDKVLKVSASGTLTYTFSEAVDITSIDFTFSFGSKDAGKAVDLEAFDANETSLGTAQLTQAEKQTGSNIKQEANIEFAYSGVKKFTITNSSDKNFLLGYLKFNTGSVTPPAPSTDPVATVTLDGPAEGFVGKEVSFSVTTDVKANAYKWYVDGAEQDGATAANFNFTPEAERTYRILAAAKNDYNSDFVQSNGLDFVATVKPAAVPCAKLYPAATGDTPAQGAKAALTDASFGGNIIFAGAKSGDYAASFQYNEYGLQMCKGGADSVRVELGFNLAVGSKIELHINQNGLSSDKARGFKLLAPGQKAVLTATWQQADETDLEKVFEYEVTASDKLAGQNTFGIVRSESAILHAVIVSDCGEEIVPATDPVTSVTLAGPAEGFVGQTYSFKATADADVEDWVWFVNGVAVDGAKAATFAFTPDAVGTYAIKAGARNQYNTEDGWINSNEIALVVSAALEQVSVSANTEWDWTKAASVKEIKLDANSTPKKNEQVLLANIEGMNNNAEFNSQALLFEGEYPIRDGKYCQGQLIQFHTTVAGYLTVEYSNTGNRETGEGETEGQEALRRFLVLNGALVDGDPGTMVSNKNAIVYNIPVAAGDVALSGRMPYRTDGKDVNQIEYLRFYNINFTLNQIPTGIENTKTAVKAVKVVRDGQMMILKNGVLYNMQGAVVK